MKTKIPETDFSIESRVSPARFRDLVFSREFTGEYRPIYSRIKDLADLVKKQAHVAMALEDSQALIGYAVLDFPDPSKRWAALGENLVLELKALEVARAYRQMGIAGGLLKDLVCRASWKEKIIFLTAYSWTWDIGFSCPDVPSYRAMLTSLYSRFGFREYPTNEPNICLRPENIFMAKIGECVPEKTQKNFKWLRFGQPETDRKPNTVPKTKKKRCPPYDTAIEKEKKHGCTNQ